MRIGKLFIPSFLLAPDDEGGAAPAAGAGAAGAAGDAGAAAAAKGAEGAPVAGDQGAEAKGAEGDAAKAVADAFDFGLTDDRKAALLKQAGIDVDKGTKYLKSRSSITDLLKAAFSADSKIAEISAGRVKVPTGKDDDPKDVAAYNKAVGRPNDPSGYAVWKPDGAPEMSDADKEMWGEALKDLHAAGVGQKGVDAVAKAYYRLTQTAGTAAVQRAQQAAEKAQEDLRVEYGRDYKSNVALANRFLAENATGLRDSEGANILDKRFSDGTALGEHPGFVKWIVGLAKAASDDGPLILGEQQDGAKSASERLNDLIALRNTAEGRIKYQQPETQAEVQRLTNLVARQQGGGQKQRTGAEQGR